MNNTSGLSIAIPSSAGVEDLFAQSGYPLKKKTPRYYALTGEMRLDGSTLPLTVIPYKASDVPDMLVESNTVDGADSISAAITDQDILIGMQDERDRIMNVTRIPGGSNGGADSVSWKCLVRSDSSIGDLSDLKDKSVGCKIPQLAQSWLNQNNIQAEVRKINGSAEAVLKRRQREAVIDVVDSGKSRDENTLREVGGTVFESSRVLIADESVLNQQLLKNALYQLSVALISTRLSQTRYQIWANVDRDLVPTLKCNSLFSGISGPLTAQISDREYEYMVSVAESDLNDAFAQLMALGVSDAEAVPLKRTIGQNAIRKYMDPTFFSSMKK